MTYGDAIKHLKHGEKITRRGWNGKNQFVILAHMDKCTLSNGDIIINPEHKDIGGNFLMFVGTSGYQCGWLASQSDMLADDWEIV